MTAESIIDASVGRAVTLTAPAGFARGCGFGVGFELVMGVGLGRSEPRSPSGVAGTRHDVGGTYDTCFPFKEGRTLSLGAMLVGWRGRSGVFSGVV